MNNLSTINKEAGKEHSYLISEGHPMMVS